MLRRFTQRAQRSIINAQEEARAMGHPAVGTEHILLGLIREGEGIGARAMLELGVICSGSEMRSNEYWVPGWLEVKVKQETCPSPPGLRVLNLAFDEARLQG